MAGISRLSVIEEAREVGEKGRQAREGVEINVLEASTSSTGGLHLLLLLPLLLLFFLLLSLLL